MNKDSVSLSQLIFDIKITLQSRYELPVWVIAEISEMNLNRSGHCYVELIEKDTISDKIIAKSRATIWAFAFRNIKAYFETTTGETLRSGLKILLKANIEFHEVYGFSLNILEIDPQYTMGDLARKKAQIIQQLKQDGVFDMNKSISLSIVPQRIAVVSSATAAGYGDFTNQLANNVPGYAFKTELFSAVMQGEKAAESIILALENVYSRIDEFDVVAIIRGGGAKSDLSCFDDYELAYFISQFPLPVLTGIGHERDDSVTDMVAHMKLKTPTAVAEFLITKVDHFTSLIEDYEEQIAMILGDFFEDSEHYLEKLTERIQWASSDLMQKKQEQLVMAKSKTISAIKQFHYKKYNQLEKYQNSLIINSKSAIHQEIKFCEMRQQRLQRSLNNFFDRKERRLKYLSEKNTLLNPERLLERGYSWVSHKGQIVKDSNELKQGDVIEIQLAKGRLESEILKTHNEN